jgi:hypothetical protein
MTKKKYFLCGFVLIFVVTLISFISENANANEQKNIYIVCVDSIKYASPGICWEKNGVYIGKDIKCTIGIPLSWVYFFPYYSIEYIKTRPLNNEELQDYNKKPGFLKSID